MESERPQSELPKQILDEALSEAIVTHLTKEEFKKRVDSIYQKEIADLISRSEKKATIWAAVAAGVIVIVFASVIIWQVADVREKQADIKVEYAQALMIMSDLRIAVGEFEKTMAEKIESINSQSDEAVNQVSVINSQVQTAIETLSDITKQTNSITDILKNLEKLPAN